MADVDAADSLTDPPPPILTVFHYSNASNVGQQVYDKKHFASTANHLFCICLIICILDICLRQTAIAEIMAACNCECKMTLLTRLRNMGNAVHNRQVKFEHRGSPQVTYGPSETTESSGNDYVSCQYCYGYYARKQLWCHCNLTCLVSSQNNYGSSL